MLMYSSELAGNIAFNGNTPLFGIKSACFMQQEILISSLALRENLQYSVDLRLREAPNDAERRAIIKKVILELSLKEAANTRVTYCSGGEKRRTSLATQLLSNRSVLYLDEPTTSWMLEALARKGRTIITTIRQPRSGIWSLFDRVILLIPLSRELSIASLIGNFSYQW